MKQSRQRAITRTSHFTGSHFTGSRSRAANALIVAVCVFLLSACETHPGATRLPGTGSGSTANSSELGGGFEASPPPAGAELVEAIIGPPPDPSIDDMIYRIGPYDDLQVDVFDVPELSGGGQVNLQGLIVLPLVGPINVNGLTPTEAERAIEEILGARYLRNPKVTVYVKSSASLNVTVSGSVGEQGVHPIQGRKTLTDILAVAGGVSPVGKKREVVLYRASSDDQLQAYVLDYQQILDGKMRDPLIVGNDRIYVPASGIAVFFSPFAQVFRTWAWPYRPGL